MKSTWPGVSIMLSTSCSPVRSPSRTAPRHAHRLALDGDAALALDVHPVEVLRPHLPRVDHPGELQHPVGQRRLAVVDVRDDAEVADPVRHRWHRDGSRQGRSSVAQASVLHDGGDQGSIVPCPPPTSKRPPPRLRSEAPLPCVCAASPTEAGAPTPHPTGDAAPPFCRTCPDKAGHAAPSEQRTLIVQPVDEAHRDDGRAVDELGDEARGGRRRAAAPASRRRSGAGRGRWGHRHRPCRSGVCGSTR